MWLLGFQHGMRASEIADLRLADVDLKNGSILIRRKKGSKQTHQALLGHIGNPLWNETKALKNWLKVRGTDPGLGDYVFTSRKGLHLTPKAITAIFKRLALMAGLHPDKAHVHALKHGLGTLLAIEGVNGATIAQQLGHNSLSSTAQYTHISDAQASKVTAKVLQEAV